jgi:hypothetical protein
MAFTLRISDWYTNLSRGWKWFVRLFLLLILLLLIAYIFFLPLKTVSMELPVANSSPLATEASHELWESIHADDSSNLDAIIEKLTEAYELHQDDEILNSLLGGAHIWRFALRQRFGKTAADMKSDLVAGHKYSADNVRLFPDQRISTARSMVTHVDWQLAVIEGNDPLAEQAHLQMLANSQSWAEFAGFVQGWAIAALMEPSDQYYRTAALGYETMLNQCAGFRLPDKVKFNKFMHSLYSLKSIFNPVCYNNTLAPHSIEGTLLSIGDAWLKQGDIERAQLWYHNATTSPTYPTWKYRDQLEDRIERPEFYRDKFVADSGKLDVTEPAMSYQSVTSCGLCHTK